MAGGAWWAVVHGVAKRQTWLSDFTFTFHFYALGKEMATHSSILAWRIPGPVEPGGLPSMGSHGVGPDWSNLAEQQQGWALKHWCFWTVVLEKTLESPLDCKEIQPVHPKGDQSSVFTGRTDAEAETPVLWPPPAKSWLIGGEGDDRGWDGWMAKLTLWTWIWVTFGSWWWTGRPGVLRFMASQRVRHYWATELNWTEQGRKDARI